MKQHFFALSTGYKEDYLTMPDTMKGLRMILNFNITLLFLLLVLSCHRCVPKINRQKNPGVQSEIKLPSPVYKSSISIEEALLKRRSVRRYKNEVLQLKEISKLLWAAQGITEEFGSGRTAPSAGALYPLKLYLVSGNVDSLAPGVYHYIPFGHILLQIAEGDMRKSLTAAASMQGALNRSAAIIVIAAQYKLTIRKYEERGIRYVDLEAGHATQNICLQAVSLSIGTVTMGSFKDSRVKQILNLPVDEEPLYLMPVGKKDYE
jgi:SagB-type dehydrogenase family enzyme